ncbi:MAG: NADH-quinone oxidoreductase subunit N [Ignavibacteriales bacterium]|nr:NADH-quinone oxidoreductase subunit N [Ignavibacteriales bacterium]
MNKFNVLDLWYSSPLVTLVVTGLVLLVLEGFRRKSQRMAFGVSAAGIIIAIGLTIVTYGENQPAFNNTFLQGTFGSFFSFVFLAAGLLSLILSREYLERLNIHRTEYYALVIFAIVGMMLMASAIDLVVLFLGVELMSLCLYVLAGFMRTRVTSNESALKYFLLGAFVTGFLLYGIALLYGTTGTTNLVTIGKNFEAYSGNAVFLLGVGMVMMGLSFKIAAAPFHLWAPDVYEGAPTSVTGFMSTAAKAAAFAAFITVFLRTFEFAGTKVSEILAILAAVSMMIGNIAAIAQNNVKRMLAYSSVAHAGYMLTGIAAGNEEGQIGIMFYLAAYVFMNLGAFSIVSLVEGQNDTRLSFDDYSGLSKQQPLLAALMSVFMFSLAGIPPLAGFFGKYYVFLAAVKADLTWLAILGVLTSLISVYYYLRLVVLMYFRDGEAQVAAKPSLGTIVAISLAAFLVLQLGLYPSLVVNIARGGF